MRRTLLLVGLAGCAPPDGNVVPLDVYRERLHAIRSRDFPQTVRILDRHGGLLGEIVEEGYRTWIALEDIPAAVREAAIATEDRTFYDNSGVDKRAVARAAVQNARAGGTVSGASTITMQLVRLVAFPPEERFEQSLERKVREVADSGLDILYISMDGFKAQTHDHMRGEVGTYDKVMRSLDLFDKVANPRLIVAMIVSRHSVGELVPMAEWTEQRGYQVVYQPLFNNFGREYDPQWYVNSPHFPRPDQLEELDEALDLKKMTEGGIL